MSRRSPANNCKRSQDSLRLHPIALNTRLSRQDDNDKDDDDNDDDDNDDDNNDDESVDEARLGIAAASG